MKDLLKIMGWLFIVGGFMLGIINGSIDETFFWPTAIIYFLSGTISGVLFFAIAKIIELLEKIVDNTTESNLLQRPTMVSSGEEKYKFTPID